MLWAQYARKYEIVSLDLPQNFPLYREDGQYHPAELADWFYKKALGIAQEFDKRNGYPYYRNSINDILEGMKRME